MIIYITGAPGVGKTHILSKLFIQGFDLDNIFDNNCKKYNTFEKVIEEYKKDINDIILKNSTVVFVGYQESKQLSFKPDIVILLIRNDFEKFYRQKLISDLHFLCENQVELENIFTKKPPNEISSFFSYNEIIGMNTFDKFKNSILTINKLILNDFPDVKTLTESEVIEYVKTFV
jgi:Cdc6-like AAA superfamily ATPase